MLISFYYITIVTKLTNDIVTSIIVFFIRFLDLLQVYRYGIAVRNRMAIKQDHNWIFDAFTHCSGYLV